MPPDVDAPGDRVKTCPEHSAGHHGRLVFLDGLRGLGALSIASFHIADYGPLPVAAEQWLPDVRLFILTWGWIPVQWFFVISGLVAIYTARDEPLTLRTAANQLVSRILRLGVAYWLVVALVAVLTAAAIDGWDDHSLNEQSPTLAQLGAHAFFLQDILGLPHLSTGLWFVCIEVQFGILLLLLTGLAQGLARATGRPHGRPSSAILLLVFSPLAVWSLFVAVYQSHSDMWIWHFYCHIFFGILIGLMLKKAVHPVWFWLYVAAAGLRVTLDYDDNLAASFVAGGTIGLSSHLGVLQTWLRQGVFQYLGRISYSLFLIHYPVSWLIGRLGYWFTGEQPQWAAFWLVLSLAASIPAAHSLHRWVEEPAMRWAKRMHGGSGRRPIRESADENVETRLAVSASVPGADGAG